MSDRMKRIPCPACRGSGACGRIGTDMRCDGTIPESRSGADRRTPPPPPADLSAEVQRLRGERDGWQETAAQNQRNADFYRDLVVAVGRLLGPEVYRCDDGSVSQDVLCLKVPEVARQQLASLRASHQEVVKAAYREGWNECIRSGPTDQSRGDSVDKCWESSDAKDALVTLDLGGAE